MRCQQGAGCQDGAGLEDGVAHRLWRGQAAAMSAEVSLEIQVGALEVVGAILLVRSHPL